MTTPVEDFLSAHAAAVTAIAVARKACEDASALAETPEMRAAIVGFASNVYLAPSGPVEDDQQHAAKRIVHGDTVRPTFPALYAFTEFDTEPEVDQAIRFTNMRTGDEWHDVELDVPISHLQNALVPSKLPKGATNA